MVDTGTRNWFGMLGHIAADSVAEPGTGTDRTVRIEARIGNRCSKHSS